MRERAPLKVEGFGAYGSVTLIRRALHRYEKEFDGVQDVFELQVILRE